MNLISNGCIYRFISTIARFLIAWIPQSILTHIQVLPDMVAFVYVLFLSYIDLLEWIYIEWMIQHGWCEKKRVILGLG